MCAQLAIMTKTLLHARRRNDLQRMTVRSLQGSRNRADMLFLAPCALQASHFIRCKSLRRLACSNFSVITGDCAHMQNFITAQASLHTQYLFLQLLVSLYTAIPLVQVKFCLNALKRIRQRVDTRLVPNFTSSSHIPLHE